MHVKNTYLRAKFTLNCLWFLQIYICSSFKIFRNNIKNVLKMLLISVDWQITDFLCSLSVNICSVVFFAKCLLYKCHMLAKLLGTSFLCVYTCKGIYNWLPLVIHLDSYLTLHLNEKFLLTKTSWDFDANLEINDSNWSISDQKFFYHFTGLAVNPG